MNIEPSLNLYHPLPEIHLTSKEKADGELPKPNSIFSERSTNVLLKEKFSPANRNIYLFIQREIKRVKPPCRNPIAIFEKLQVQYQWKDEEFPCFALYLQTCARGDFMARFQEGKLGTDFRSQQQLSLEEIRKVDFKARKGLILELIQEAEAQGFNLYQVFHHLKSFQGPDSLEECHFHFFMDYLRKTICRKNPELDKPSVFAALLKKRQLSVFFERGLLIEPTIEEKLSRRIQKVAQQTIPYLRSTNPQGKDKKVNS
ncbi:MAG: hypothetical protein K0S07_262 [Chlamydiales bacterium]|nr:hypothetical protein [Chlamydiales bacterium]